MSKKTVTLEQLLESARKSEELSVQVAQAAQAELDAIKGGQIPPTGGNAVMTGDLDMGTHRIKFGDVFIAPTDVGTINDSGESEDATTGESEDTFVEEIPGGDSEEAPAEEEDEGGTFTGIDDEAPAEGEIPAEENVGDESGGELTEEVTGGTGGLKLMYSDGTLANFAVADPQNAQDAATKGYVDGLLNTLKESIATLLDEINGEAAPQDESNEEAA